MNAEAIVIGASTARHLALLGRRVVGLEQEPAQHRSGRTSIAERRGGILVVAAAEPECGTLAELERRARGVAAHLIEAREIPEVEPQVPGLQALHAPDGASFDAPAYVRSLVANRSHETLGAAAPRRPECLAIP